MSGNRKNHKKASGFTLIEVILVLALVTTLGALAAPQFTDVFDHSKDQADIAQMDQILAAFQLQQTAFYEEHNSRYDMLNDENVKDGGDKSNSKDVAEGALYHFLLDALTSPGSAVYMEGVTSAKDGKQPTEDDLIYEIAPPDTHIWLVHKNSFGKDTKSNVKIRIPGPKDPINYEYSDENLLDGTWMIIGDDDRLREDYVKDLIYHVREKDREAINNEAYKKFKEKVNRDHEYRYRTAFKIITEMRKEPITPNLGENLLAKESWVEWVPQGDNSTVKIKVYRGDKDTTNDKLKEELKGVKIEYWKGDERPEESEWIDARSETPLYVVNNSSGNEFMETLTFKFSKEGEETKYRVYKIEIKQFKKTGISESVITDSDVDAVEGYIWMKDMKTNKNGIVGNPHFLHYKYIGDNPPGGEGSSGNTAEEEYVSVPAMEFVTGFVYNYVNKNSYDFLAFQNNAEHQIEIRYYKMPSDGNPKRTGEWVATLETFQYDKKYLMELEVNQGNTELTLYKDGIKIVDAQVGSGSDLHPAIGYYMNDGIKLENKDDAVTEDVNRIPLVHYGSNENAGPRFILLSMPEFYPYTQNPDSGSGTSGDGSGGTTTPEPNEPEAFICKKPEIKDYSGDPRVPYEASAMTRGNSVQYKWVEGIENIEKPAADQGWGEDYSVSDGKSGWIWVREYKGDSFAPAEKWEKKPWVNIDDYAIDLVSTEVRDRPEKQKISFQPEQLPNDFYWYISRPGKERQKNSIWIDNGLHMREVEVQVYIKWKDEVIVSDSKRERFGYHNFGAESNQNSFDVIGNLSRDYFGNYYLEIFSEDQYRLSVSAYHDNYGREVYDFYLPETIISGDSERFNLRWDFEYLDIQIKDMQGNVYLPDVTIFSLGEFGFVKSDTDS